MFDWSLTIDIPCLSCLISICLTSPILPHNSARSELVIFLFKFEIVIFVPLICWLLFVVFIVPKRSKTEFLTWKWSFNCFLFRMTECFKFGREEEVVEWEEWEEFEKFEEFARMEGFECVEDLKEVEEVKGKEELNFKFEDLPEEIEEIEFLYFEFFWLFEWKILFLFFCFDEEIISSNDLFIRSIWKFQEKMIKKWLKKSWK